MASGCWKPARQKYGVVVVSYSGTAVHQSLSLQFGETIHIWEEYWIDKNTVTWLRGCVFNNKNKKGIFPANYVQTKKCTVENEGPFEVVVPVEDAIIKELTYVLREWNELWKLLFVKRKSLFQTILLVMGELVKFRSTLVSNTLTKEHAEELKEQVVTMIDWGNGQLGMDLVPRVHYQQADPDKVSVVEMFRIHERSVQNCRGAWPGGTVKVKSKEKQKENIHHLLVSLYSFACNIGDCAEVLLSLYDNRDGKFISEKFVMYFNREGQREASDKNNSNIFTELSSEDITGRDLYLVLQVLRKGRLITDVSFKKAGILQYRRPWGVSVLSLRDLFQINSELEYFLRVQYVDNDSFGTAHEGLIKKQVQMVGKTSATDKQNQGVTLSLKLLHGDMKAVKNENPMLFSKGLVLTQRMGFSDFINPGEIRNDLYLTLHGAEFDRGSKTASKNVEVKVTVYNDMYGLIKECILPSNGGSMKSSFQSYVLYHCNSPKWNETVRLSLPIEKFSSSHIRLEFYHCSNRDKGEKKLYGFAFLSVTTKDCITRLNGKYDLCIYKCDDVAKIGNYLNLPSLRDEFYDPAMLTILTNSIPYQHSNKEYASIETLLCSSKFAQKNELLSVLQWTSNPNLAETLPEDLDQLLKLKGHELVRYLQDILDALFNMLTSGDGRPVPFVYSIFDALVRIFSLLHEEKFEKFTIVLEDYLEKSFSSPLAHKELMLCLRMQVEKMCSNSPLEKPGLKVFKVLDDVLKFAVKSCMLSQRMDGGKSVLEFKDNLKKLFETFVKVVQSQGRELQKVQIKLLENLHKSYVPLFFIVPNNDLAQLVVFILNNFHPEVGGPVVKAKTNLIKNTINSQLVCDAASRNLLLPLMLGHLKKCLIMQHHLDLTANTLGDLLTMVYNLKATCDIKEEVTKIIQGLFDVVVKILQTIAGSRKKLSGNLLVACLIEMLQFMDINHYHKLTNDYAKPKPLKDFLNHVLMVFRNLVRADCLPSDWITMRMITNNVMLTSIHYIADDLTENFLNEADFDKELWLNFFLLAMDFITQPALQLEAYSEAKGNQIKSKYTDMRVPVGFHIHSLWNQLGPNKTHFMLDLIGPFLQVTMVPQPELRKATIPIFFDIIQCEYQFNSHLRRVESRMIKEMDSLVLEHLGDVQYKKMFQSILLEKVQAEPELREEGKRFVFSVTDLLERLLDYRDIMDREEQRDTKMHCTFNILNFYKDSRRDMYIRYITRLYELHYSANNFVEAALTLRLYAQLLSWSLVQHPAEMSYPAQTEAERKEELFVRIMDCFDKGKAWEYGIPLCKELADYYEKTFQYKKLGQILQKQAYFLYQILEGHKLRQDPTYYRVAYYGNTFPPYLKNKAFIYRGDECLKLATIMSQLMTEYPTATILSNNSPPDEALKHGDAQYIQIVSVKPVPSERPEFAGKVVPNEISCFYNTNEVDTFQYDRPYHREGKDHNNEFKSLCLERTIIHTSYKLPGILRWYEVTSTKVVQLGPIQTATDSVLQMNAELRSSSDNGRANPDQFLMHLEMRLQGVIFGAVNGGIPKYQEAFFNEEYKARYPNEAPYIEQLKSAILEQLQLLELGLAIHGKFASAEMQPLHRSLVDSFIKIKKSMGYQNSPSLGKNRGSSISSGSGYQRSSTPSTVSQNSSERLMLGKLQHRNEHPGMHAPTMMQCHVNHQVKQLRRKRGNIMNMSTNSSNHLMSASSTPLLGTYRTDKSPSCAQTYMSNRSSVVSACDGSYHEEDYTYVDKHNEDTHVNLRLTLGVDKRRSSSLRVPSFTYLNQISTSPRPLSAIITSSNHFQYHPDHVTEDSHLTSPPPPPPPRQKSSPDMMSVLGFMTHPQNTQQSDQAPPIPSRKYSKTSVSFSEHDNPTPPPPVYRSQSTKSIYSGEVDSLPPPPRPSRVNMPPTLPGTRDESPLSVPPIPVKSVPKSPLATKSLSASILSNGSQMNNNNIHSTSIKINSETNVNEHSQISPKLSKSHEEQSSPIALQGASNKDALPSHVSVASPISQNTPSSLSRAYGNHATPISCAPSELAAATTPQRPFSKDGPPPIPKRKPSVTPS